MEEDLWDNSIEDDEEGEYLPDEPVKSLPEKTVENCFTITAGSFTRNLLHPKPDGYGKIGIAVVMKPNLSSYMLIGFQVLLDKDNPKIFIRFSPKDKGFREQTIRIDAIPTTLGNKPRLVCDCGHAGKLYLRSDCFHFMCFNCCRPMKYGIKTMDKRWKLNAVLYYLNRDDKLRFMQSSIRRPFYIDKATGLECYTRRARAFMHLVKKWHKSPGLVAQVHQQLA